MGRSIARGSKKSLIDQCHDDPETRKFMLNKIGRVLKGEMKIMSQVKTGSILRSGSYDDMKVFQWETLLEELKLHAPVLYNILDSCTSTKHQRINRSATIGICAAILLRYRCSRMSLVQKVLMLVLHASHCGKQVKLQCMLCRKT